MDLYVTSSAIALEEIPARFTCDDRDVSPPLKWTEGPAGTASYALIMDDPDAPRGTWVHWVAWNIRQTELPEGVAKQPRFETGGGQIRQGTNSWGRIGYGGPCPPSGTHRYFFKVYALDTELDLGPETNKGALRNEMNRHVLAEGELMATYSRSRTRDHARRP